MATRKLQEFYGSILAQADVKIGGQRPWDIQIKHERLFRRVRSRGLVGLGEAFVEGDWECDAVDQFTDRCLRTGAPSVLGWNRVAVWRVLMEKLFNLQSPRLAWANGRAHYNLGNELFEQMLDSRLTYSCAYWDGARNLDEAQEQKLERICRKLAIEPEMRILDIGCGWGSFAGYAAERYGCRVVGMTVSEQQAEYVRHRYKGLPIEVRLQDYREVDERFDRIVSIGMFEHVGQKNHRRFMRVVRRCLKDDGLCLLHFFATQRSWPNLRDTEFIWVTRNIFPGGVTPSMKQVGRALDGLLVIEDLENFGAFYDPTLMAWHENFLNNWDRLKGSYDERFFRMWRFYLLLCAGAFRSRKYQVWQMVLARQGVPGGYRRPTDARQHITPVQLNKAPIPTVHTVAPTELAGARQTP